MNTDRTLIVVPTYNERENVRPLVAEILRAAPEADVCLLDDNSPDGTAAYAEELFDADARFSVLRRKGARGYGRSLVDGYRKALEGGYARLVQLDADFSHDPARIPALIEASHEADVVIGSRYCEGGGIENWPLQRRVLSRFANAYVGRITGLRVRDTTSGFRCYTRRALTRLLEGRVAAEGYAFLVEAIFHAHREGLRVSEVPITFTDRREGQSKMSRKVIIESVLMPWRLRFAKEKDEGGGMKDEGELIR
ncbi:MAG: dolichol-phosphate mannosyltransferase [Acidobacteriota bacterium]|jgi:dolichol-phosphate mannosyltransferase|nr:dolichol-phosphate mannosyltransferase [Acidobacteriota bacterium]MDT7809373.1 dolichol-phosphate mannosyltransferase [Acidobacteriota bacterium]